MKGQGTVVNGVVVPDTPLPPHLEGTRVRVWLLEDAEDDGVATPHVRHAAQDRLTADDS
jgi:hypothetical protein